jgi:Domain of unknown function (DUF4399)
LEMAVSGVLFLTIVRQVWRLDQYSHGVLCMFSVRTVAALAFVATTAALVGCATPAAPTMAPKASMPAAAAAPAAPAMADTAVSLMEPADGATVTSPFKVKFGVKGMAVAPAGDVVAKSGHHHLLINLAPIKAGEAVPFTPQHMHFGKGQTEAEVSLAPGVYKLTAQFANGAHESYGPAMSQTVTVTVK